MANTLKFGTDGNWATKEGSTLAYNDENGNFKPLPFDFTRATSATRVNKQGLIETVSNNEPRIDFLNDSDGALLLEPTRSNLVTFSEQMDNAAWSKTNATVTANATTSPDGTTNADKLIPNTTSNFHSVSQSITDTAASWTYSVFAKSAGYDRIILWVTSTNFVGFNLSTGVVESTLGFKVTSATIQKYGNGWYRCSITSTSTASGTSVNIGVFNADYPSGDVNPIFTGNGTDGILIYGAQMEQGSYATSYIPTQNSIGTRVSESCNGAGNSQVFNDSEGVLMAEISALGETVPEYTSIGLGIGSSDNRIGLGFEPPNNIYVFKRGVSSFWLASKLVNINEINKVAISYNTNDNHFWLNGVKIKSDTTIGDIAPPTELGFEASYGGEQFYGNTKQIQYFNTALTDQELQALTTL